MIVPHEQLLHICSSSNSIPLLPVVWGNYIRLYKRYYAKAAKKVFNFNCVGKKFEEDFFNDPKKAAWAESSLGLPEPTEAKQVRRMSMRFRSF